MAVKKGYQHNWKYTGHWKEKKIAPGKWKIRFRATKGRRVRGRPQKYEPKKGFQILWKINAYQRATKTGRGTYQTDMYGTKKVVKAGYKKKRQSGRWHRKRY